MVGDKYTRLAPLARLSPLCLYSGPAVLRQVGEVVSILRRRIRRIFPQGLHINNNNKMNHLSFVGLEFTRTLTLMSNSANGHRFVMKCFLTNIFYWRNRIGILCAGQWSYRL